MKYILLAWMLGICLPLVAQDSQQLQEVSSSDTKTTTTVMEPVEDRTILVKPKTTSTPANVNLAAQRYGLKEKSKFKHVNWRHFEIPASQSKKDIIQKLKNADLFEHVMEPKRYELQDMVPNDPLFPQMWGLTNISAPKAWDIITDAPIVIAAVVDTGIDFTHPDLIANLWTGPVGEHGYTCSNNMVFPGGKDDHGHGTHVAGTIGAVGDNGIGTVGVAWNTKIMSIKVLHHGSGSDIDIVNGLEKLIDLKASGVPVLVSNHSYGGTFEDPFLEDGFRALYHADIFASISAGNANHNIDIISDVPAIYNFPNIISTMACTQDGLRATFSNFGIVRTDIAAPGVNVLSTLMNNSYGAFSGTSMAAPHVCGLALLLRQSYPNLSALQIRDLILNPNSYDSSATFSGNNTSARINAFKSVTNSKAREVPFRTNTYPQLVRISPSVLLTNNQSVTLSADGSDADGDILRWKAGVSGFFAESAPFSRQGFLKPMLDANGFKLSQVNNSVTLSSDPFSVQLASVVEFSASDNRGGGFVGAPEFEIARNAGLKRQIPIKTWTARTNAAANNRSVTWVLDVDDPIKTNYTYCAFWAVIGPRTVSGVGFQPGAGEQSFLVDTNTEIANSSLRAFILDRHLNFRTLEQIAFPSLSARPPVAVVYVDTNEANVPFTATIDLSQSVGNIVSWSVYDFVTPFFSLNQQIHRIPFSVPGYYLKLIWVADNNRASDVVLYPFIASRFFGQTTTNVPPPDPIPTNPPPSTLIAPKDLSADYAGGRVWIDWTEESIGEDRVEVQTQTKAKGPWSVWSTIAVLEPDSSNYSFIPRPITYRFRVRCCKANACSGFSNTDSVSVR